MSSPSLQDISLYELALSSEQPPHPLQISPTIFKTMLSTVIDLLIDQQIPATLWLKLPRGEVWQAELDRFRKLAGAPKSIYELKNLKDIELDQANPSGNFTETLPASQPVSAVTASEADLAEADANDLISDASVLPPSSSIPTNLMTLPLATHSRLKREYFLLVLAPEFRVLILAHRPRSVQKVQTEDEQDVDIQPVASGKNGALTPEEIERKHPLLGLCSFDTQTVQQVLEGVNRAICCGQSQHEPGAEVEELLVNWDQMIDQQLSTQLNPFLLGHFFTRQVQRQEDIWHGNAVYRRQAENASLLQLENEELLNAIRLKDEFLKNVGQELRTPLSTMKTALTLLNSPNLKPTQRQRYLDLISQECDRQSSLITSVLDLIQLDNMVDQSPMQPLRLMDVVPGVVSTYQPLAQEKGIMLAYTIPEDLPAVSCLNTWLRQIVINLLHNSIKFTAKGGQVWVRAKQQGDYIQIEFRDTGIGIPTAEVPKIFERFYKVRQGSGEESSGAGLGLSIVQQLLLRCSGSISVKSQVGEGSTFAMLLPIYNS